MKQTFLFVVFTVHIYPTNRHNAAVLTGTAEFSCGWGMMMESMLYSTINLFVVVTKRAGFWPEAKKQSLILFYVRR